MRKELDNLNEAYRDYQKSYNDVIMKAGALLSSLLDEEETIWFQNHFHIRVENEYNSCYDMVYANFVSRAIEEGEEEIYIDTDNGAYPLSNVYPADIMYMIEEIITDNNLN